MSAASELQKAVDKLLKKEPRWREATQPPAKGPQPGQVATGRPATGGAAASGSGFVEADAALREYWAERIVATSSDGLFVLMGAPIKKVFGSPGPQEYRDPPAS